jgi:hypothetical protein
MIAASGDGRIVPADRCSSIEEYYEEYRRRYKR